MPDRSLGLPLLAVALVIAAYAASLSGGWVWDDHYIVEQNPALDSPLRLWTESLFGPTGRESNVYRPLVMMTFLPGHVMGLGAGFERLVNLGLHVGTVVLLGVALRALGMRRSTAWLLAALFGVHTGATEAVAWISGRQDLLPGALCVAALAAWARDRPWLAGALLIPAPFCKESFVLGGLAMLVWCLGRRRIHPAVMLPLAGVAAYLILRQGIALPMPGGVASQPLGALGAVALRLPELALWPLAPTAFPSFTAAPWAGAAAIVVGAGMLVASWGRPRVAAATGLLLLVVPGGLAAVHTGLLSDRYLHAGLVAAAVLAGAALRDRPVPLAAWVLAVALAVPTGSRAVEWTSDMRLFSAEIERFPENAQVAFHLGNAMHRYDQDCEGAVPLYRKGVDADPRALTNLQACLMELERPEEALALTAAALATMPWNPNPASNGARAAVAVGDLEAAERWARVAVERDPERARNRVLLGNVLGQRGRCGEAGPEFEAAVALDPDVPGGSEGLAACRRQESGRSGG